MGEFGGIRERLNCNIDLHDCFFRVNFFGVEPKLSLFVGAEVKVDTGIGTLS